LWIERKVAGLAWILDQIDHPLKHPVQRLAIGDDARLGQSRLELLAEIVQVVAQHDGAEAQLAASYEDAAQRGVAKGKADGGSCGRDRFGNRGLHDTLL
jgi:hypothetical protein